MFRQRANSGGGGEGLDCGFNPPKRCPGASLAKLKSGAKSAIFFSRMGRFHGTRNSRLGPQKKCDRSLFAILNVKMWDGGKG